MSRWVTLPYSTPWSLQERVSFSVMLSRLPMVAFPGNHEVEEDYATGEYFMHFRQRFRMPEVKPEYVGFTLTIAYVFI